MAEKRVSILPSDMVQGGLIADLDVTFAAASFVLYDYNGKADPRVCARIEMKDDDDAIHEQFFSAADPKHFAPSQDGNHVVSVSDKGSLVRGSNYEGFIVSLINAGFPEPLLRDGIGGIVGTKVHIGRKAAPVRAGIINQAGGEGQRERTVVFVEKLIDLPGEGVPKTAKVTGKQTAAAAKQGVAKATAKEPVASSNGAGAVDEQLAGLVLAALEGNESLAKKDLVSYVFKNGEGPAKREMVKRVATEEFLDWGMEEGKWMHDGGVVSPL